MSETMEYILIGILWVGLTGFVVAFAINGARDLEDEDD